jgi:hypothetical protein
MARGRPKKAPMMELGDEMVTDTRMLDDGGSLEDLHPFVMGLLQELPLPGTFWAPDRRELWLATATSIFKMIYTETAPPPMSSPPAPTV